MNYCQTLVENVLVLVKNKAISMGGKYDFWPIFPRDNCYPSRGGIVDLNVRSLNLKRLCKPTDRHRK